MIMRMILSSTSVDGRGSTGTPGPVLAKQNKTTPALFLTPAVCMCLLAQILKVRSRKLNTRAPRVHRGRRLGCELGRGHVRHVLRRFEVQSKYWNVGREASTRNTKHVQWRQRVRPGALHVGPVCFRRSSHVPPSCFDVRIEHASDQVLYGCRGSMNNASFVNDSSVHSSSLVPHFMTCAVPMAAPLCSSAGKDARDTKRAHHCSWCQH